MEMVRLKTKIDIREDINPIVRFNTNHRTIVFNKAAYNYTGFVIGDRIDFITVGDELFFCVSKDGNKLYPFNRTFDFFAVRHTGAIKALAAYKIKKNVTLRLKKTNHEYKGSKLFQVVIPKIYMALKRRYSAEYFPNSVHQLVKDLPTRTMTLSELSQATGLKQQQVYNYLYYHNLPFKQLESKEEPDKPDAVFNVDKRENWIV